MIDDFRFITLVSLTWGLVAAVLLGRLRWFSRPSLTNRLAPFSGASIGSAGLQTVRQLVFEHLGGRLEQMVKSMGVAGSLDSRIDRAGLMVDADGFRARQLATCAGAGVVALFISAIASLPGPIALLILGGIPVLCFLAWEQHLVSAVHARQTRLFGELPVVAEQIAMLLNAGYSVGSAISRLSERSSAQSGEDLRRVTERVRQGLSVDDALAEWATRSHIPELDRLVAVLSLGPGTTGLAGLVSAEARAIRHEAQRRLGEALDKRAQQVWVPVTVATLIPGVVFLAIPFVHALRALSGT